jgi:hypothetical protein
VGGWRQKMRYPDALEGSGKPFVAHEVKAGYQDFDLRLVRQIKKDAALKVSGTYRRVVWHFVANERDLSIGANPAILSLLRNNGIDYVVHVVR